MPEEFHLSINFFASLGLGLFIAESLEPKFSAFRTKMYFLASSELKYIFLPWNIYAEKSTQHIKQLLLLPTA